MAAAGPDVVSSCTFAAIAAIARENLDQSAGQVGVTVSRSTLDRLRGRTEAELERLRGTIEARAARGVPRDTHGDLRLDHVYWYPDRPPSGDWIAIDCIEFDPRYRHADPIADIAFLAMELAQEGRSDLGAAFVEAYLRAAGDAEGRMLVPFYRAYRAAVRGKVEGLKLSEPEIPEAERSSACDRARALWLRALSELEGPARTPCLLLLAGLPGTGKSTLARALAGRAGFTVLRTDAVRKELAGRGDLPSMVSGFGEDIYTPEWDDRTYGECLRQAAAVIFQAGRVVVDASFRAETRRRLFLDAARRWGVAGRLLLCRADPEVIRNRLELRRDDASDAGWRIYQEAARRWEPLGADTQAATHEIDAGDSPARTLAEALAALREDGLFAEQPR
jgi:predicted kinase